MRASRLGGLTALLTVLLLNGSAVPPPPSPPPPGAAGPRATVTVHGRPGSFGTPPPATASGQSLVSHGVPGWGFPPGVQAGRTVLAADGTVLVAGQAHTFSATDGTSTAAETVVAAYDPRANTYTNLQIARDPAGRPSAPPVGDLEPLAGGTAVAFAALPTQQSTVDGGWPVLGVLSKVDGRWRVADRWTAAQLRASDPALGPRACPEPGPAAQRAGGRLDCGGLLDLAALPRSRDLIVAQYTGGERGNGALAAVRVTGPDGAGRFTAKVVGHLPYPEIRDPARPGQFLEVAPWVVQADPTGVLGDERFVVTFQIRNRDPAEAPGVLQEFGYDADTGAIRPVSAPIVPGDRTLGERGSFYAYGATLYDSRGNLWAGRLAGLQGGRLAVYARTDRRPAPCPYDPGRRMDSYRTSAGARTVWGQSCRPDYDIVQAQALLGSQGIVEDPVTHDIASLGFGGAVLPVRVAGSGRAMTFRVGNVVDIGRKMLPTAPGNWADHRLGGIDAGHRLWIAATHARIGATEVPLDQWLYTVDIGDLFEPGPVPLPDTPGRSAVVEAERTTTTTTTQRPGRSAAVEVDSDAYVSGCPDWPANVGCGYDGTPGNGFVLADDSGFGHLGRAVEYRVEVRRGGEFRLGYRVAAFPVLKDAAIRFEAAGRVYTTAVVPGEGWRTIWSPDPVMLPAGVHTVRISAPPGGAGWALNSLTLQRA